jgi:hypothetical protein
MSEVDTPHRVEEQEYLCCCVLINAGDTDDPIECNGYAGPDAPFCGACDGRHWDMETVKSGYTQVTQRLRRRADA